MIFNLFSALVNWLLGVLAFDCKKDSIIQNRRLANAPTR